MVYAARVQFVVFILRNPLLLITFIRYEIIAVVY